MKTHRVTGGGGIELHIVETGNSRGRPILFIHGTSQCWLQWDRQLNSSLAETNLLIALDMRGHGLSDKPRDAYGDSKLWADDINAVISSLKLDHPVLSGWSYGPLVILDYIRHYGEDQISGMHHSTRCWVTSKRSSLAGAPPTQAGDQRAYRAATIRPGIE